MKLMKYSLLAVLLTALAGFGFAQELEPKPNDPYFENFKPVKAPRPTGLVLRKGDRLAIAGDSITEQKMYSRIMETYLTVCVPELEITARQYGWGGEVAPTFLRRMTNDCLRFKPTIATTCYGMNDHGYRAYEPAIGDRYRQSSTAIVQAFKANGARVIQGSPGCVSHKPEALNLNLCTLRNIGIEIAESEKVGFADVFWPMVTAEFTAHQKYATNYWIAGGDGVHPGWSGHLVMAYAFLKSFGLDGDIGTFTVDLKSGQAQASKGHKIVSARDGEVRIESDRYPFCASDPLDKDSSVRSAMTLIPFNQELNRLMLVAKNGSARSYKVTWGAETKEYAAEQLAKGVNLANDFAVNPFSEAFKKVDAAVIAKQNYETKQIKQIFHDLVNGKYKAADDIKDMELKELFTLRDADGKFDRDAVAAATEKKRSALAAAIKTAFVPVTHTLRIEAN